jgi:hypothetical protein
MNNLKGLRAFLLALLAMGALAPAAHATKFTASEYPTTSTAESAKGNDAFTTEAGSVECTGEFETESLKAAAGSILVMASYTNCKAFGFESATVNMNGCDYFFYASGSVDLECPSGRSVSIVASSCEVTIGPQAGLGEMQLANSSGGIEAKANVGGISYTVAKDGLGCPFGGTGAKTGGKYTQAAPITFKSTNGATVDLETASGKFTMSSYPTTGTSEAAKGSGRFETEGGAVECNAHYQGTLTVPSSSTVTISPTYTSCKAFGFEPAGVSMNGCDYVLHSNGEADLECGVGQKVVITTSTCEVQIGTQTALSKVELFNGSGDIKLRANVSGISYTVAKDGFGCPFAGTGVKATGKYTHTFPITAKATNGATIDIG